MILAFGGEAIFAVANFKEEGPTKEHKEKWYFVTKIVLTYCEKKMF